MIILKNLMLYYITFITLFWAYIGNRKRVIEFGINVSFIDDI